MSSPFPSSPPPYKRPTYHVARHVAKSEPVDRDLDLDPPAPPEIHRPAIAIRVVVSIIGLIGLGVVAALGGFERDPDAQIGPPRVAVGQTVDAGVYEVTINGASAGTELRGKSADDGTYLLEVDVTIVNRSDRTRSAYRVVTPDGLPGIDGDPKYPDIVSVRDERLNSTLQPGIPERVAMLWTVNAATAVPKELKLQINGVHPRPTNFRFMNWNLDEELLDAILTLPVRQATVTR